MILQPIDTVRQVYADIEAGDIDAFYALLDDDMEWDDHAAFPGEGTLRGRAQIEAQFDRWFATWDDLHYEIQEAVEDGPQVIAVVHRRGIERATGIEREDLAAYVYEIHDGRIARLTGYTDRSAAIESAGLKRRG